jgi:hypothetical protein
MNRLAADRAKSPQAAKASRSVASAAPASRWQALHGHMGNARLATMLQLKLTVSPPDDVYEQEADRVADEVMRMPEPADDQAASSGTCARPRIQRLCPECEEGLQLPEDETLLRRRLDRDAEPDVSPRVEDAIRALTGRGQPLPDSVRSFMEPRFGTDFSAVRVHTDARAGDLARAVNAQAFTVGRDIVFRADRYAPDTEPGRHLLAHELTHVVQQGDVLHRANGETNNVTRLRELLRDDDERAAIALMGRLSPNETEFVLSSREFKELAIDAFNDDEMYRGVRTMRGDLYWSLQWLFDEGTNWDKLRDVISNAPSGHARVRQDNWMKAQFVDELDDAEMAQAVDLLGGSLLWKLSWMQAERVTSWALIRAKLTAAGVTEPEKAEVRDSREIRGYFVDVLDDGEMAAAVDLLGGRLIWKLSWMRAEAVDSWNLIRAKLTAAGVTGPERVEIRGSREIRDYFVSVLGDDEMAQAVDALAFDLKTKLEWMVAEGTSYALVKPRVVAASAPEKAAVLADRALLRAIRDELSWNNFARTVELLGRNAPSGATMLADPVVRGALAAAWAASGAAVTIWNAHDPSVPPGNPCNPPPGAPAAAAAGHEEGGFVYLNLVTGDLAARSVAAGAQASIPLDDPPDVADSIVVGGYHTHPNVGPCWGAPFLSGADLAWAARNGVPILARGAFPTVAATSDVSGGPTRLHLAGDRGLPGAAGGLAPQANRDGRYDEV